MEFFKSNLAIDFMALRNYTKAASIIACFIAVFVLSTKGLTYGLDFTGGLQVEMRFPQEAVLMDVTAAFTQLGAQDVKAQYYGSTQDVLVRFHHENHDSEYLRRQIITHFQQTHGLSKLKRIDVIGAEMGTQLTEQGGLAVFLAILCTMIYITCRFEYRFALSAAAALIHDILLVLALLAILKVDFDLTTLAAILAILGYSLNDTIVVFDRVRENFKTHYHKTTVEIMNISLNQTLSRTLMTSWLTLIVVLALLFFGGEALFSFSIALCLGIIIGTYSSIYVAGALAVAMGLSRQDLIPKKKPMLDEP